MADDFGVTDFYCIEQNVLLYLTTSGSVYAVDLCSDPGKNLQVKPPKRVDKDVVAIGKCIRGSEANLRGQSSGRLMVVKRNLPGQNMVAQLAVLRSGSFLKSGKLELPHVPDQIICIQQSKTEYNIIFSTRERVYDYKCRIQQGDWSGVVYPVRRDAVNCVDVSKNGKIVVGADDGLYIYDYDKFGSGAPDEPCIPDIFAESKIPVVNVVCCEDIAYVVTGDDVLVVNIK